MADVPTWYLGPLGNLRPLGCPELDVEMNQVRYGGIHQGLTGSRTVDITGTRADYGFEFKNMEKDEWTWLEAMNTRLVPGPFYLLDPMKKNRLTVQACQLRHGVSDAESVSTWLWNFQMTRDKPSAIDLPIQSLYLPAAGSAKPVRFQPVIPTPVLPQETIVGSVYAKSSVSRSASLLFDYYGPDGTRLTSPSGFSQSVSIGTSWTRLTCSTTVPAAVAGVRFALTTGAPTSNLTLAAPQLESGSTATSWEMGGGGSRVIMDQLKTTSHRFPLRDSSLVLLEA